MAKADAIRAGAKLALAAFENNEDYIWLQQHKNDISPKENKRVCLDAALWYAEGLEKDIAEDNLVCMRRKVPYEHYLESFSRCRRDMEAILSQRATEPQLSLFSADAPQAGLNFSVMRMKLIQITKTKDKKSVCKVRFEYEKHKYFYQL